MPKLYGWCLRGTLLFLFFTLLPASCSPVHTASLTPEQDITRVNQQQVWPVETAGNGPRIWTDRSGFRAVDRDDRSWREHFETSGAGVGDRLDEAWENIGPFAADVNHIITSHVNRNVVYAAVAGGGEPFLGGVYKSTNGGQDWERLAQNTMMGAVNCLSMNPESAQDIFASADMGLFRTTNGGNSWIEVFPTDGTLPLSNRVAHNPGVPGEILVHYECDPMPSSRLFRSRDGGQSFEPVGIGLPGSLTITDICYDPLVQTRVFISEGTDFGAYGFYYSEDGGLHWSDFSDGLDGMPVNAISVSNDGDGCSVLVSTGRNFASQFGGLFRRSHPTGEWYRVESDLFNAHGLIEVQRNEQFPDLILVGTQGAGLLRSADDGQTWATGGIGQTGEVVNCISMRDDGVAIHAGCEAKGVFTSADWGENWVASSQGINMVKVTDVAVDDFDPNRILVSFTSLNSGGIFITEDGGASWDAASGLVDQRAQSVVLEGVGGHVIYAAMEGPVTPTIPEGIYKSTDGGQSWTCTGPDGPAFLNNLLYKIVAVESSGTLLAGGRGYVSALPARMFRSTDGGGNWSQVHEGDSICEVVDITVSPLDDMICYAAVNHNGGQNELGGVLKSTDGGVTWTGVDNGFGAGLQNCQSVSVDPVNPDIAYAAILNGGIFRTTDGGAGWQLSGFPMGFAYAVLVNPLFSNTVFASCGGFPVLESKDGGASHVDFSKGYPEQSVSCFGFDDRFWQPRLYACGNQGLYRRDLTPLGSPDTFDLALSCSPTEFTLPATVDLGIGLSNTTNLHRSFGLVIDVELPGGTLYPAYRQGSVVLTPGEQFSTVAPVDFPLYGTLVGVTTFTYTGTDITPPEYEGGVPAGFSDSISCQVSATAP